MNIFCHANGPNFKRRLNHIGKTMLYNHVQFFFFKKKIQTSNKTLFVYVPLRTFCVTTNVLPVSSGTVQLTGSGDRMMICSGDLTRVGSGGDLTMCSMISCNGSGLALDTEPASRSVSSSATAATGEKWADLSGVKYGQTFVMFDVDVRCSCLVITIIGFILFLAIFVISSIL